MNPNRRRALFLRLQAANPTPTTELAYRTPFELLVAVVLSAQATDKSVNQATASLFAVAGTPGGMLSLGEDGLEQHIRRIGLYRTKAKNLLATCRILIAQHAGEVPRSRADLEALPGVGRKTANVLLNTAFGEPTIAVDTHIFRVANRTGLASGKTVLEVEKKLLRHVPAEFRLHAHHWLILHGRYVCKARKPDCPACIIRDLCDYREKTPVKAATGLTHGRLAEPALAAEAVRLAMERADLAIAQAVLLYLSADFAHDPQPAITAAARAANCLQVAGCTAAGVFTEEDWMLDAPAAAALVLGDGASLHMARPDSEQILTLAAPNALDMHWLEGGAPRYGGVSGDASGQGPFSVWCGCRVQAGGRCELALHGAQLRIGISQGVRPMSKPATISRVDGHDVQMLGGQTALASLVQELPLGVRSPERIPTHLLMAGIPYGERENAVAEGRFHLLPVIAANADDKSVTVAGVLTPGLDLFWAMRQPHAAEQDMRAMVSRLADDTPAIPAFGLMFPCMGRGPFFYGGQDRDIQVLARRFPTMPLIGFYGNGEIAHLDGANRLLQYSVVLGLAYELAAGAHV